MIEINNLTTVKIDEKIIKNIIEKVLERESSFAKATEDKGRDISVAFVGQGRIRVLNKKYRGKNRVTDVLTFGQGQRSKVKSQKFPTSPKNKLEIGEIIICLREVKKNAKRLNSTFEKELVRILIHGTLHLLGYEHKKDGAAAEKMEERQEKYLEEIFINKSEARSTKHEIRNNI